MESDSYYALNKIKDIRAILNVQFKAIKSLFKRYAIKKEKVDSIELTAEKFFTIVTDISNLIKFDLVKLSKEDFKTDYNIDIFDFLRKIVGMAINLIEKPEENDEVNNPGEKNDLDYIGLNNE